VLNYKSFLRYAFGKLLALAVYIFAALTLVFMVINLMPGDPAYSLAVYFMQTYNLKFEQALEMARVALGYDVSKPVHVRYLEYLSRLMRGELGYSLYYKRPAVEVIALSLPWTLLVLMLATIASYIIGTRLGVFAAFKRGKAADSILYSAAVVMLSMPPFIVAVIVLYLLGLNLRLIPLGARPGGLHLRGTGLSLSAMSFKEQIRLQAIASALLILVMAAFILPALKQDAPEYYVTILVIVVAILFVFYVVKDFLKETKTVE